MLSGLRPGKYLQFPEVIRKALTTSLARRGSVIKTCRKAPPRLASPGRVPSRGYLGWAEGQGARTTHGERAPAKGPRARVGHQVLPGVLCHCRLRHQHGATCDPRRRAPVLRCLVPWFIANASLLADESAWAGTPLVTFISRQSVSPNRSHNVKLLIF